MTRSPSTTRPTDPGATGYGPALRVSGLTKIHGASAGSAPVRALDGVDALFPRGTFTAVMGPSGSGKSTLLNCVAGIDRADEGVIEIAGHDLTVMDEDERTRFRRERIGFVFQSFQLVPYLTAGQNVELPYRLAGRRPDRARVRALLNGVGMADRADHLPSALSGGQQQRVAIARALVTDPALILADEPTGALDSAAAREVLGILRHCVDDLGQTVIMVTHDPVAAASADLVLFLVDGRLVGHLDEPTADAVAARLTGLETLVEGRS